MADGGLPMSSERDYLCLECSALFDKPKHYVEHHGLDSPPYEEYDGCPICGGAYCKVAHCDGCGAPLIEDYILIWLENKRYCQDCYQVIKNLNDSIEIS